MVQYQNVNFLPRHFFASLTASSYLLLCGIKYSYSRLFEERMWIGMNHIGTLDFFDVYASSQNERCKLEAIEISFTLTTQGTYDLMRLVLKLNIRLSTPEPLPPYNY